MVQVEMGRIEAGFASPVSKGGNTEEVVNQVSILEDVRHHSNRTYGKHTSSDGVNQCAIRGLEDGKWGVTARWHLDIGQIVRVLLSE
jgi:hypothetical protein